MNGPSSLSGITGLKGTTMKKTLSSATAAVSKKTIHKTAVTAGACGLGLKVCYEGASAIAETINTGSKTENKTRSSKTSSKTPSKPDRRNDHSDRSRSRVDRDDDRDKDNNWKKNDDALEEDFENLVEILTRSELVELLRRIIRQAQENPTSFTPAVYRRFTRILRKLIRRGAHVTRNRSGITIVVTTKQGKEEIFLDETVRKIFANSFNSHSEESPLNFRACGIYRFLCRLCQGREFNYIGQSINVALRVRSHFSSMARLMNGFLLQGDYRKKHSVLARHGFLHGIKKHIENQNTIPDEFDESTDDVDSDDIYDDQPFENQWNETLRNMFEVTLVRDLYEHDGKSEKDRRTHRAWEVFFQWLFGSMTTHGGGGRR